MTLWLVEQDRRSITADRYHQGYKKQMIEAVEAAVYHYTGSTRPNPTRRWLTKKDAYFQSSHFLVERDGAVWQMAPLDERCWHAGGKTSKLLNTGNVNGRTIGIEIMNVGPLARLDDGTFVTSFNKKFGGCPVDVDGPTAMQYGWGVWEKYSEKQILAVVELTNKLKKVFPILAANPDERLVGHQDVDPSRKMDPGPVFPWSRIRAA